MKKIFALFLSAILSVCLFASCSETASNSSGGGESSPSTESNESTGSNESEESIESSGNEGGNIEQESLNTEIMGVVYVSPQTACNISDAYSSNKLGS